MKWPTHKRTCMCWYFFFVFVVTPLGNLLNIKLFVIAIPSVCVRGQHVFSSTREGVHTYFLWCRTPKIALFSLHAFYGRNEYPHTWHDKFGESEEDFSFEGKYMPLSDDQQTSSDGSTEEKSLMRIIEKIISVVITHYVMLAGKCTVYKSLRNKESFS